MVPSHDSPVRSDDACRLSHAPRQDDLGGLALRIGVPDGDWAMKIIAAVSLAAVLGPVVFFVFSDVIGMGDAIGWVCLIIASFCIGLLA